MPVDPGEQARADSVRVLPELLRFETPVPVRSVAQQAGMPPDRAAAALGVLASNGQARDVGGDLWEAVR